MLQQCFRRACFCHCPIRKRHDLVCSGHGAHPMGNHQHGLICNQAGKSRLNQGFILYTVASFRIIMGAFFSITRAMAICCRSPPESSQPFSPIWVFQPSGSFTANLSTLASLAASNTCSSVASLFPIHIFSIMVLSNRVTS